MSMTGHDTADARNALAASDPQVAAMLRELAAAHAIIDRHHRSMQTTGATPHAAAARLLESQNDAPGNDAGEAR